MVYSYVLLVKVLWLFEMSSLSDKVYISTVSFAAKGHGAPSIKTELTVLVFVPHRAHDPSSEKQIA